jgi:hypothetical protein
MAGSRLGLLRVERTWQMRMHLIKNRIASDYCERRFALLFVVLSLIPWIASRDVQVC